MRWLFLSICLLAVTGCAHYPVNARLARYDPKAGYRFDNLPATPVNTDGTFVVLALSGGGARAAGFSFGVLEELARTRIAGDRSLLDEVDVITSVSGSSFVAAYYALHHERTFDDFPRRYLYRNLTAHLAGAVANPYNWFRMASPTFDRVDLAAEEIDHEVFDGASYADLLAARRRPYLLMTGTDISLGRRFEFTQEQFDFLYSDLASVTLARAVAASAAFPVFLTPVAFDDYPHGPDFAEPPWVASALVNKQEAPREARRAADLRTYEDAANRAHVRVLDGAGADYLGLRAPMEALQSESGDFSIRRMINQGRIKKLVVISVNAVRTPEIIWDKSQATPGWYDMLWFTAETPMRNNTADTVMAFRELLASERQAIAQQKAYVTLLRQTDPVAAEKIKLLPEYESYFVAVDFASVPDETLRRKLEAISTGMSLHGAEVEDLRRGAVEALHHSADFKRVVDELNR